MNLLLNDDFALVQLEASEFDSIGIDSKLLRSRESSVPAVFSAIRNLNLIPFVLGDASFCNVPLSFGTVEGLVTIFIPIKGDALQSFSSQSGIFLAKYVQEAKENLEYGLASEVEVTVEEVRQWDRPYELQLFLKAHEGDIDKFRLSSIDEDEELPDSVKDLIDRFVDDLENIQDETEGKEEEIEEEYEEPEEMSAFSESNIVFDPDTKKAEDKEEVTQRKQKEEVRKNGYFLLRADSIDTLCDFCSKVGEFEGESFAFKLDGKFYLGIDRVTEKIKNLTGEFLLTVVRARDYWMIAKREELISKDAFRALAQIGGYRETR